MKRCLIFICLSVILIGCNPSGKPAYEIPEYDEDTPVITYNPNQVEDDSKKALDQADVNEVLLEEASIGSTENSPAKIESVTTSTDNIIPRRVLYITPADPEVDLLTIDILKSEITQVGPYFQRFSVVDVDIDTILNDRANTDIDYIIRDSEVYGAELLLQVKREAEANTEVLALRLYCVESRELIASDTQLLSGKASTTDQNRIIRNVATKGFENIVQTYIQNVEQFGICPSADYSER